MKAAIKYLIIWILINFFAWTAVIGIGYMIGAFIGHPLKGTEILENSWILSSALLLTNLLVIFVFWKRKYTNFKFNYGYTYGETFSTKQLFLWAAVSAIGLLIFDVMASIYLPIPEDLDISNMLLKLMTNPIGLVGACLIGPLSEEVIFRGAIERRLLEKNWNPWFAIVISAALFAVSHLNFAQGLTAFVIGIFMGWVYYRTRSIWVTALIHMVNNTVACLISLMGPESMIDEAFTLPLSIGIPALIVSIILIYITAKKIGWLTKDRTPIPAPVTEVLPPPLPAEVIGEPMPPEA